jgi:Ala-tRNA(Pro) deacylase
MTCLDRLEGYLREHGVAFQMQHHYRAFTAQQVASSAHISGKMMAKVVMVLADGKLVMLVLPAAGQVDLGWVAAGLGAREVYLASERDFASAFPDCELGAEPPFGNLYGLPVYVDTTLAEDDMIVFQAGTHTETISMHYEDYDRLVQPVVGAFTHHKERFPVTPIV